MIQAALWPGRGGGLRSQLHIYAETPAGWGAICGDPWRQGLGRVVLVPYSGRNGLCRRCAGRQDWERARPAAG